MDLLTVQKTHTADQYEKISAGLAQQIRMRRSRNNNHRCISSHIMFPSNAIRAQVDTIVNNILCSVLPVANMVQSVYHDKALA